MSFDRGAGRLALHVPRSEELVFEASLDLGVLGNARVGRVVLSAGVEDYRAPMPFAARMAEAAAQNATAPGEQPMGPAEPPRFVGWMRSNATGRYLGYTLDHELHVRHLPQEWPRILYRDTQTGSEHRRRELRFGLREGLHASEYRSDRHCKGCDRREHFVEGSMPWSGEEHCKKCKSGDHRVWKEPRTRELPVATVDMLSAVYLARTFLREELPSTQLPVLDRDELWLVTLTRGGTKIVETPAGRFACVKIKLSTTVPEGEDRDPEDFRGLFGIHGDIRIFLEESTGVPVLIEGDVPLGPFELKARIALKATEGTEPAFRPLAD